MCLTLIEFNSSVKMQSLIWISSWQLALLIPHQSSYTDLLKFQLFVTEMLIHDIFETAQMKTIFSLTCIYLVCYM